MKHKKEMCKIKQTKVLTVLLLSIFVLSISALAKTTKNSDIIFDETAFNETLAFSKNIITKLISNNEEFQKVDPNKPLSQQEIEELALNKFTYYRKNFQITKCALREFQSAYISNGSIHFTSKGMNNKIYWTRNSAQSAQFSTKINIDQYGNFTVSLTGEGEKDFWYACAEGDYKATIRGTKRKDGYYDIDIKLPNGHVTQQHICDSKGVRIDQQRREQNSQSYLQGELDNIKYLSGTKKDMIAAILAGNGIYDIDYLQKDGIHKIYADKLDARIEIRFVKTDAETIHGVYIISGNSKGNSQESNTGSEIYSFKYSDESTPKKQRIQLTTARVVQVNHDEKYPSTPKYTTGTKGHEDSSSSIFMQGIRLLNTIDLKGNTSTKSNNIYENFVCDQITYTTYTLEDKGRFYKNGQEMF